MQFRDATYEISLPPLDVRREIVARIAKSPQGERERSIVEGNRELFGFMRRRSRRW
ncbi:MAG: hypothetical protein QY332_10195 [Anaerolineales bacterium]|nr:MAG: hypothetical protein QY332_10195 [Anaerolineales bacterium]